MNRNVGRSPHGERGLKFLSKQNSLFCPWSLPTRGAWIEMMRNPYWSKSVDVAPHTGSVD